MSKKFNRETLITTLTWWPKCIFMSCLRRRWQKLDCNNINISSCDSCTCGIKTAALWIFINMYSKLSTMSVFNSSVQLDILTSYALCRYDIKSQSDWNLRISIYEIWVSMCYRLSFSFTSWGTPSSVQVYSLYSVLRERVF